jgi:hypothetical protein
MRLIHAFLIIFLNTCLSSSIANANLSLAVNKHGAGEGILIVHDDGSLRLHKTSDGTEEVIIASGVTGLSGALTHTLILKDDGTLWGYGMNNSGQQGNGKQEDVEEPELIMHEVRTASLSSLGHTLVVKKDGSLWGMGYNSFGQLGIGKIEGHISPQDSLVPVQIIESGVKSVSAGNKHSLFIKEDGSLWGMGGALPPLGSNIPREIEKSGVLSASAGWDYSLYVKTDGSLWGFGINMFGQLGDGSEIQWQLAPIQIMEREVQSISPLNFAHSLIIKKDGSLWSAGNNSHGQLGKGTKDQSLGLQGGDTFEKIVDANVNSAYTSKTSSLFVKNDGSVWGMGEGYQYISSINNDILTPKEIFPAGTVPSTSPNGSTSSEETSETAGDSTTDTSPLPTIPEGQTSAPPQTVELLSTNLGNNWKQSSWFGTFYAAANGWQYHESLGWAYGSVIHEDSVWFWNQALGWFWTGDAIFPYLYISEEKTWFYLTGKSKETAKLYDYRLEKWRKLINWTLNPANATTEAKTQSESIISEIIEDSTLTEKEKVDEIVDFIFGGF